MEKKMSSAARAKLKEREQAAAAKLAASRAAADASLGPSTSRDYEEPARKDADVEMSDAERRQYREMLSELRSMMDQDSVFSRIRGELVDELQKAIGDYDPTAEKRSRSGYRRRFEFYELLDDLIGTLTDVDAAHMAVLCDTAMRLSKHAPLEVLNDKEELEHVLFTNATKASKSTEEKDATAMPKRSKKSQLADDSGVASMSKSADDGDTPNALRAAAHNVKDEPSASGIAAATAAAATGHSGDRAGLKSLARSTSHAKLDETTSSSRAKAVKSAVAKRRKAEDADEKAPHSSDSDYEKTLTDEPKKAKRDYKKTPIARVKSNGVAKSATSKERGGRADAGEKTATRSGGSELSSQKKRRAAAIVATASVSESLTTPVAKRRTTRAAPAAAAATAADDAALAEQTYCLCEQISYGNMICCDNDNCTIEWYHFDCVRITAKPARGKKWFCPSCRGDKSTMMRLDLS